MEPLYLKHDHQESGNQSVTSLHHFAPYNITFQLLTQSYKFRLVVRLALEIIVKNKNNNTNKRLKCISMRCKEDDRDPH